MMAWSTTAVLGTGSVPGKPKLTGPTKVFGRSP
jgi:hypothetical protein